MSQHERDVTFFVVWLLNKAARAWGKTASQIYALLQQANLVDDYLIPFYDVLHSMGEEALLDDIAEVSASRGISL